MMNYIPKYIAKVEISNLWKKHDIEWTLNSDVNVLSGANGSGKTTIFDLILGTLILGNFPKWRPDIYDKVIITFNNGKIIGCDNFNKDSKIGIDYNQDIYDYIAIDTIRTFDKLINPIEEKYRNSKAPLNTELDWEIYKLQRDYLDYQLNISKRKDLLIEETKIDEYQKLIQPQKRFLEIIDNLFSETNKQINRVENEISFITEDGIEISPYELSSGEKQILLILLTVLIQDNKPAILLLDEPEISLHIDWQKKAIQYIKELNPNIQLIIATHSPAIVMEGWLDKVTEVSDITKRKNQN